MTPPMLWALLSVAHAVDAFVVLPGLGPVTLADAAATCTDGHPVGSVAEAAARSVGRQAAFQAVGGALLARPEADRRAYWKHSGSPAWPERERDVTYTPALEWVPLGVVTSCFAVGTWYAGVGLRTANACQKGRGSCKDMWPEADWERVKDIPVGKVTPEDARDPYFLALHALAEPLTAYRNPLPYLTAACDAPGNAARQARLIDVDDLLAARRACLQQYVLVQRTRLSHLGLPCDTPWSAVVDDEPQVWTGPYSDLGLTDRYRSEQVETLRDRLVRMDPNPGTCEAPWAVNWRKDLLSLWRDGQTARACADDALALADRAALCPSLHADQRAACDGGDLAACDRVARLTRAGTQTQADEAEAARLFLRACDGGVEAACPELTGHAAVITSFAIDALARAAPLQPDAAAAHGGPWPPPGSVRVGDAVIPADAGEHLKTALGHVRAYAPHLDAAWARGQAVLVFDAALLAGDAGIADAVLADFGPRMDPAWLASATKRHGALVARLQQAALDALQR
jgi:hypothetical protein